MPSCTRTAPAKINLSLRILGRRADGYHQLEGLVAFSDAGDVLRVEAGEQGVAAAAALTIDGPFGAQLVAQGAADDNLVLRAARLHAAQSGERRALHFHLTKNLPIASGIGGGSSDAAAALGVLQQLAARPLDDAVLRGIARELGADVPMCLCPQAQYVAGIGEITRSVEFSRPLAAVLVNPGVAVSTREVFRELAAPRLTGDPAPRPMLPPGPLLPDTLIDWLQGETNDLEAPALRLAPVIGEVLAALRASDSCRLARMSGSGATCFAIYDDEDAAARAALLIAGQNPHWWVLATQLR